MRDMSDLWSDVVDVPLAVEATLGQAEGVDVASRLLSNPDVNRVVIAGNGASYYVGLALWIGSLSAARGPRIVAVPAGLLELSLRGFGEADRLVVVSSSGELRDAVDATRRHAARPFVLITASPDSPLARSASAVVVTQVVNRHALTHTQAYCAAMVAALSIMASVWQDAELQRALVGLPSILTSGVAQAPEWAKSANLSGTPRAATVFGSGPSWTAAMETALLLKEVAGIAAEGHETREGATTGMYALGPDDLGVSIPTGPDRAVEEAEAVLRSRGSHVLTLPGGNMSDPRLSPLTTFPFAAALAISLAERNGRDASSPPWRDAYLATTRHQL
jgi:fructoselysine-6-P-deglycase FrlB-like protein